MAAEHPDILQARTLLAAAEASPDSEHSAWQAEEALALLEALTEDSPSATLATNIATAYCERLTDAVRRRLQQGLSDTGLKQLFDLQQSIVASGFASADARALSGELGERLLQAMLRAYPPEQRERAAAGAVSTPESEAV